MPRQDSNESFLMIIIAIFLQQQNLIYYDELLLLLMQLGGPDIIDCADELLVAQNICLISSTTLLSTLRKHDNNVNLIGGSMILPLLGPSRSMINDGACFVNDGCTSSSKNGRVLLEGNADIQLHTSGIIINTTIPTTHDDSNIVAATSSPTQTFDDEMDRILLLLSDDDYPLMRMWHNAKENSNHLEAGSLRHDAARTCEQQDVIPLVDESLSSGSSNNSRVGNNDRPM
jgi:hypothetical protein